MDPDAALEAIRELITRLDEVQAPEKIAALAEELCILVQGLDEWLAKGGFLPDAWQRDQQATALGKLILGRKAVAVGVHYSPFDLPDGYVEVSLDGGQATKGGFTAGISATGEVSS